MKKKMYITIFVMLVILAFAFTLDKQTDGYPMNIKTDEDMMWNLQISDPGILAVTSEEYSGGKYRLVLNGIKAGQTEIIMQRTAKDNPSLILEERNYHMKVDEKGKILQESVDRTVY